MKLTTRIAALVAVVALAASACSSGDTATSQVPILDARPTTTAAPAVDPAPVVELVPATVEEIGVTSVVPRDWAAVSPGSWTGEEASIGFGAIPTWAATDPVEFGLVPVPDEDLNGRDWNLYSVDAGAVTVFLVTTERGATTYFIELHTPPPLVDHYIDSVGTPAIDAFQVEAVVGPAAEIESATAKIDGRTMAYVAGGSGTTTVVFETGLGGGMSDWGAVAPAVAESARVFAYDRPGYGGSDPTDTARDGATMVAELRQLLSATGHEPPYVLVGWSIGGTVMDLYARTHPDEVSGLVLVDSRHHEYTARCLALQGEGHQCLIPEEYIALSPRHEQDEWWGFEVTEEQLAAAPALDPELGLAVVAAGLSDEDQSAESFELWHQTQREYAALVPGSSLAVLEDSNHQIPGLRPDAIIDAVAQILQENG